MPWSPSCWRRSAIRPVHRPSGSRDPEPTLHLRRVHSRPWPGRRRRARVAGRRRSVRVTPCLMHRPDASRYTFADEPPAGGRHDRASRRDLASGPGTSQRAADARPAPFPRRAWRPLPHPGARVRAPAAISLPGLLAGPHPDERRGVRRRRLPAGADVQRHQPPAAPAGAPEPRAARPARRRARHLPRARALGGAGKGRGPGPAPGRRPLRRPVGDERAGPHRELPHLRHRCRRTRPHRSPPTGHGLLGVSLREGQRLRLSQISRDPRAAGFPPNHPPMRSLVAVPILCRTHFRGNLYLAEKLGEESFSVDDEETLVRFATKAAIAIDHAFLHRQLASLAVAEERLRIAHEMHDGLAQVLAYVNTKAQAVREFLRTGRTEEAARQLDQLAAAAREVYGDVRDSIVGLRGVAGADWRLGTALADYVAAWQEQSGVACRLRMDASLRFPSAIELQLLRIVQEALANVRKHAQARHAEVVLEVRDGVPSLTVADDGVGFHPGELGRSEFPRFGLATMRERAESIGGKFEISSSSDGGTRIQLVLPVPAAPLAAADGA